MSITWFAYTQATALGKVGFHVIFLVMEQNGPFTNHNKYDSKGMNKNKWQLVSAQVCAAWFVTSGTAWISNIIAVLKDLGWHSLAIYCLTT